MCRIKAESLKKVSISLHFNHRYTAEQVGANVMRLWRRRIIYISPDVQTPVVGLVCNLFHRHTAGVIVHVRKTFKSGYDLFDIFWKQIILGAARVILGVSINKKNTATPFSRFVWISCLTVEIGAHHQKARRNASAVEEIGRQSDDGLDQILLQK